MATNGNMTTLYYLLFAKYASSCINSDYPEQWKMKLMAEVFKYGPTWSKRLEIQEKVRALSDDEISKGSISIYNNAMNPDTTPSTDTWDTLQGINNQNASLHKRGKLEAYSMVDTILRTDVTSEFINRFGKFFIQVLAPQAPLWYDWSDTFPTSGSVDTVYGDTSVPLFGNYTTNTFEEMFPDVTSWIDYYKSCGIPTTIPEV